MRSLTQDALAIWQAGVDAVRADRVVETHIDFDGRWLSIADEVVDLQGISRLVVVGAGKASFGMLAGLMSWIDQSELRIAIDGHINVPEGVTEGYDAAWEHWPVRVAAVRPRGSNEPNARVVDGTQRILNLVSDTTDRDLVIALISGGGSALLCSPIDGLSLEQKIAVTRRLSASGATITELNAVRRCLSHVKGGGLARACRARQLVTCILSDVLGDPIEYIASGPTVLEPKPSPRLAIDVLRDKVPGEFLAIEALLEKQINTANAVGDQTNALRNKRSIAEPLHIVLANNATAVDAAGVKAVELGYRYWMQAARECEGDATQVGAAIADQLKMTTEQSQIDCIISGGEPTVHLPAAASCGKGGRNQQLALSVYRELMETPNWEQSHEIAFVSGGTDGEDGPTDAAGAWVDRTTMRAGEQKRLNPSEYLARCDAYHFFEQTGGLLITGPTNTNVCDLRVGLVRPRNPEQ